MERNKLEISREELFDVNMMITISISVSGSVGYSQLEAAFANAVSSFEILNTRIVIDGTGAAYYEPLDHPGNRLYHTEKSLDDLIREQEKIRFRIEDGEYIRLFVDDRESDSFRLHFLMHHTGGDGKSLCYFAESFLRSLGGENLPKRPLHLLTPDVFPKNNRLKPFYRFYIKSRNRRWEKEGRVFGIGELEKASDLFWKNHETEILRSSVTAGDMKTQLRECHDNDISISNLGVLDIPLEYGGYRIDDFWFIPPNTCYARDVIGMVTVNGRLNMARHRYKRKKSVAIVTGATGGLGNAFVRQVIGKTDEIWAIGRNKNKLQELQQRYGDRIKPFLIDLSDIGNLEPVSDRLKTKNYTVKYLINNAGSGRMASSVDFSAEEIRSHISTHNISPAVLCNICIPHMEKESHILNVASQAAFQPLTYINLYAAGKAFCCSYSRALNMELKNRGITVTAICPGWINTDLIKKKVNGQAVTFPHLAEPDDVAKQALKDAEKGKDMSVYSSYVRRMQFYSKIYPHSFTMKIWNRSVEKYIK